jgi:hypothetical protein
MSKSIELSTKQWDLLLERLRSEYPPSVFMIRTKMKEVLGFTTRDRRTDDYITSGAWPTYSIFLDFFDESKRTFFLLKYGDLITPPSLSKERLTILKYRNEVRESKNSK